MLTYFNIIVYTNTLMCHEIVDLLKLVMILFTYEKANFTDRSTLDVFLVITSTQQVQVKCLAQGHSEK